MNKPHVIVCGAGIGGLTTAHELAKRGVRVTVFERHKTLGGLARSEYHEQDGKSYPVEYSWRVYGTHYKNMHRLFSEIPLSDDPSKTVIDNLVKIDKFLFPHEKGEAYILPREQGSEKIITNFTAKDKRQILEKILYCITMSEDRMDSLDHLKWTDFCDDLSEEARKYVVRIWGPVLGMDPSLMNFPVVARMMKVLLGGYSGSTGGLYVMNKPTNDGWFDVWAAHLESTGHVHINTEHEIVDFVKEDDRITGVVVKDREGNERTESADYVVCSMSVETVAALGKKEHLSSVAELTSASPLSKAGRQVQLSIQLFLDQKLKYPTDEKQVLYLPDTPWALIIEPEALIWDKTYSTDERVRTVLSIGICHTDVPGVVHEKAFVDCNEEEIQDEVMTQMMRSYHTSITNADGTPITRDNIVLFYIWHTFERNNNRMDTWEPKFSNNVGTFAHQPSPSTSLKNLFFATAYTRTKRFIYSMEAATEAGMRAANAIVKKESLPQRTNIYRFQPNPLVVRPLAWLDKLLFRARLPHLSKLLFGSSIALVLIYVVVVVAILVALMKLAL